MTQDMKEHKAGFKKLRFKVNRNQENNRNKKKKFQK